MKGGSKLRYWRRRNEYDGLNGSARRWRKTRMEVATLGLGSAEKTKKRVSWKIKIKRKLRFFCYRAPKKFFTSLRDGYVKMMLRMSTSRVVAGGLGYAANGSTGYGFTKPAIKEYDEKMIIEIYKAMIVREQSVPELKSA
ncbi:hypothetical protein ACHQM5_026374 [Ranunculus cassubicifolius]